MGSLPSPTLIPIAWLQCYHHRSVLVEYEVGRLPRLPIFHAFATIDNLTTLVHFDPLSHFSRSLITKELRIEFLLCKYDSRPSSERLESVVDLQIV